MGDIKPATGGFDGMALAKQAQATAVAGGKPPSTTQAGAAPSAMAGPKPTGSATLDAARGTPAAGTAGNPQPIDIGPIGDWLKTLMARATN
jgi:hypothetical protein